MCKTNIESPRPSAHVLLLKPGTATHHRCGFCKWCGFLLTSEQSIVIDQIEGKSPRVKRLHSRPALLVTFLHMPAIHSYYPRVIRRFGTAPTHPAASWSAFYGKLLRNAKRQNRIRSRTKPMQSARAIFPPRLSHAGSYHLRAAAHPPSYQPRIQSL